MACRCAKDEESMDFEERVAVAVTKLAGIEGIGILLLKNWFLGSYIRRNFSG